MNHTLNFSSYVLFNDDYLKILETLPDKSIDLICIDPPYAKINGMILSGQKRKVNWDDSINWDVMFKEFNRIIKDGGTILVFGQNPTYSKMLLANLKDYKYEYTWIKNNSAQGFHKDKMPLIYTENIAVFIHNETKEHKRTFNNIIDKYELDKNLHFARWYAKQILDYIKLPRRKIYEVIGNRKLEFFLYFNGKHFGVCSKELYDALIKHFHIDKMDGFVSYETLKAKEEQDKTNPYDSTKYTATLKNYFEVSKENKHYHPTQKPTELLNNLINIYSNKNDIVLDCFMGSGSCGVSALKNNRRFIGIEKDREYYEIAKKRIEEEKKM